MASKTEDVKSGQAEDIKVEQPGTPPSKTSNLSPSGAAINGTASPSGAGKSRFNLPSSGSNNETPGPIGTPVKNAGANGAGALGLGAKSMPGSRRTSAMLSSGAGNDVTFGLEKLSLGQAKEEDVGAEGARGTSGNLGYTSCFNILFMVVEISLDSVNFLNLGNEDEGYPAAGNREAGKVRNPPQCQTEARSYAMTWLDRRTTNCQPLLLPLIWLLLLKPLSVSLTDPLTTV
jgi:hypothetical protein